MGDEIGNDAPPTSRRTRVLLAWLVAAAVVVAGVVALRRGVDPVEAPPPSSPPAAQMPPLPGQLGPAPTESLPPVPALLVSDVCQPLRTDGRSTLDVSFTVVNTVPQAVTLVRITPVFPLPGLRGLGTEYRSGTCQAPGPPCSGDVPPRGTMLVVLHSACRRPARRRTRSGRTSPSAAMAAPPPPASTSSTTSAASTSRPAEPPAR